MPHPGSTRHCLCPQPPPIPLQGGRTERFERQAPRHMIEKREHDDGHATKGDHGDGLPRAGGGLQLAPFPPAASHRLLFLKFSYRSDRVTPVLTCGIKSARRTERGADFAVDATAIQKSTRVLISLWDSLMFGRVPGTRPNISESHSEISTRVPFCITKSGTHAAARRVRARPRSKQMHCRARDRSQAALRT